MFVSATTLSKWPSCISRQLNCKDIFENGQKERASKEGLVKARSDKIVTTCESKF